MIRARSPRALYRHLQFVATLASTTAFATVTLYRFLEAGLSPLQLVLVGTAMEAAVFVAEIPTGVVADVVSRRTSIVVGHLGIGIGLLLEGAFPSFVPILLAQVFWGVSYTFTSGATEAWLAGEVGEDDFGDVLLAGSQVAYPAALVGLVASYGLGLVDLRAPLLVAGVVSLALGLYLAARMPETGFRAVPRGDRQRWTGMVRTTRAGTRAITRRRPLLMLAVAIVVWGAASEAFDRLGQPLLIDDIGLPQPGRSAQLLWLGGLSLVSLVLGFLATSWIRRARRGFDRRQTLRWVLALSVGEVVAMAALGLAGSFAFGAIAFLAVSRTQGLRAKLLTAWIVPLTDRDTRATSLSVLGQANAAGQSLLGPGFGWVGSTVSLPAAMLSAGALLAVTPALVAASGRADDVAATEARD